MRCVADEENGEYASGVRQSARIAFDDEILCNEKWSHRKSSYLGRLGHPEERIVEGHDGTKLDGE